MLDDKFMIAVKYDRDHTLVDPANKGITKTIKARELWFKILETRVETGEPYILFSDNVNCRVPISYKKLGLEVKTSNLCSEITLATGLDHLNNKRTAVCCLSSVNLEYWDSWKGNEDFIHDIMLMLDNVLEDFIGTNKKGFDNAKYSALRERSVGLGTMGFHSYLQKNSIHYEHKSVEALTDNMYRYINLRANRASHKIAMVKGSCEDYKKYRYYRKVHT